MLIVNKPVDINFYKISINKVITGENIDLWSKKETWTRQQKRKEDHLLSLTGGKYISLDNVLYF